MTNDVLKELAEMEATNRAAFNKPLYPFGDVVAVTGVKPATLRNWLTRKQLVLNADEGHTDEKWRLFSARDMVQIAVLHSLSSLGLSVKDAVFIADAVMPRIENMAVKVGGYAGDPVLHFWKADGAWCSGTAFDTSKGMLTADAIPPAALSLRPFAILSHVQSELKPAESGDAQS